MPRDYSYENDKTVLDIKVGDVWLDHWGREWRITRIEETPHNIYPIHGERIGPGKTRECSWMWNGGAMYNIGRLVEKRS